MDNKKKNKDQQKNPTLHIIIFLTWLQKSADMVRAGMFWQ